MHFFKQLTQTHPKYQSKLDHTGISRKNRSFRLFHQNLLVQKKKKEERNQNIHLHYYYRLNLMSEKLI